MSDTKQNEDKKQKEDNERAGGLAGVGAGVIAGAQVGTVLIPIPVIGTFTGALVGGALGSKVGKKYGGALLDKMTSKKEAATAGDEKKDVTAELERLATLHKQGILDDTEFKAAKASLLNI